VGVSFRPHLRRGAVVLSRPDKPPNSPTPGSVDFRRRNFLIGCCQGTAAALIPAGLSGRGWPTLLALDSANKKLADAEFHLYPHYRTPRSLDALLLKTHAGFDDFATEQYAEEIAEVLQQWSSGLLRSPQDLGAVERVLLPSFSGSYTRPVESRVARPGPMITVRNNRFHQEPALGRDAFLQELRSSLSSFSKILTAELQVTGIDAIPLHAATPAPAQIQSRIRYELVGASHDFYREQRVGYWRLEWERSTSDELRIRRWQIEDETQSHSIGPGYIDIAAAALGSAASYSSQLLHGTDYWRTILDGTCGIDIYGHNGVSIGDIDGDGFDDLYVCQPGGLPNRLYRNRGNGTFEDITESAGVGVIENTACALFVDIDNDGKQDLIVVRATGPMLFLNEGGGKFRQKADAFQFASTPQGTFTGAAVTDYDRDGWLDIYFCLYVYYQGTDQYKYPSPYYDAENGPPNFMMRNNRDGTFYDVTAASGLNQNNTRYSFCCGWNDFNRDGWPDLYVVNDFGRKNLYRNNGNGTFTDVAVQSGVEDVGAGMSVCWFDYNNDGADDLYVANMWTAAGDRISMQDVFKKDTPKEVRALYHKHAMGNSLFRNVSQNNGGAFEDTTRAASVGIGRWAWSSDSWDFDHDGFPDLYITNGMVTGPSREDLNSFFWRQVVANSPDLAKPSRDYEQGWSAINELIRADGTWSGYERNIFYANNGDGTFSDISGVIGLNCLEDGRAFALADFDHDGRQEVFLKNRNGPQLRLLKNVIKGLPPSISFRLRGTKSNRDAIGAVITVETELGRQVRSLQAGSGFLSQHSKDVLFGLGAAKGPVRASIHWPSGLLQEIDNLPLDHRVWVEEGSAPTRIEAFNPSTTEGLLSNAKSLDANQLEIEALPTTAETWLLAPVEAPDFSLQDLNGQINTLSSLRGMPVLLNFWAAGAEQCKKDWATFNQYHAAWTIQGLRLFAVNLDIPSDTTVVQALAREHRLSFPILCGTEDVAAIYNILYRYLFDRHRDLALPTSFLINASGEIVKVYQGPIDADHVEHDFRDIPQTSADRLSRAFPFPGVSDTIEFGRNYLSYGSVYFQRGYMDQAVTSFRMALRDDPSSAEALYGIGSVYLNQQKTADARDCFERALKLHASYPDTLANSWNNLGLLSAREGHTDKAVNYFQEALKLSPDHTIALDNLGSAYRQQKRWDDARTTYDRALQVNADDAEANYGLGMIFAQNDDTARAFDYLQRALKLRPVYPEALNNLGILYLRTQRRDEAVASFENSIRVAPAFDQSYLNLARVYVVEGAPDKARAVLLDLLKQRPGHEQAQKMIEQLTH
jgi:tetratricopeptide (TPR) repeat protein/peroxiredoxin